MARPSSKHPTQLELEILQVLWTQDACSVRQIQEALGPKRELAYTTITTMLTIMTNKGYVRRTKSGPGYVYHARIKQDENSTTMLQDVVDRVFGGSVAAVMEHLIETSDLDAEELKTIRQLVGRKSQERKS